jgi:hypothetical protein
MVDLGGGRGGATAVGVGRDPGMTDGVVSEEGGEGASTTTGGGGGAVAATAGGAGAGGVGREGGDG